MTRLLPLLLATMAVAQPLPKFEDYKISLHTGKIGQPPPPLSADRQIRCCAWFEDHGPINFAGRYRLTTDTCGSECDTVHVVDRASGRHFVVGSYGHSYIFSQPKWPQGIEHRPDSRLLIIRGCRNDEDCGTHYLLMGPNGITRIRRVPFD